MLKHNLLRSTICAGLLSFLPLSALIAKDPEVKAGNIYIGPGLVYDCQEFLLYRGYNPGNEPTISVTVDDSNYKVVRHWVFKNIYNNFNKERPPNSGKYEYVLALFSRKGKCGMDSLTAMVHLNKETLGDDFEQKIVQLRELMKNSKPSESVGN